MGTSRKSLMIIWFVMPMILVFSGSFQKRVASPPEQQDCDWQLVDTREAISSGDGTGELSAYRSGNSIFTSHIQRANEFCAEQIFQTTHTWTEPGDILTPGQELPLSVSAAWNLIGERGCSGLTAGVLTYMTIVDTSITARQDHIAVSVEPNGSVSDSDSWIVPSGSTAGDTMYLKAGGDGGGVGGTVTYNYQYVCESTPEQSEEPPAETDTPELAAYRLAMNPAPHTDPLKLGFQLEKMEPGAQNGEYTPVAGAVLKVQVCPIRETRTGWPMNSWRPPVRTARRGGQAVKRYTG